MPQQTCGNCEDEGVSVFVSGHRQKELDEAMKAIGS